MGKYQDRTPYRKYIKFKNLDFKDLDTYGIGNRIKKQRGFKDLTRKELADYVGISEEYMADIEYGTKITTVNNIYKIAKRLSVSVQYVLTGKDVAEKAKEIVEERKDAFSEQRAGYMVAFENIVSELSRCTYEDVISIKSIVDIFAKAVISSNQIGKDRVAIYEQNDSLCKYQVKLLCCDSEGKYADNVIHSEGGEGEILYIRIGENLTQDIQLNWVHIANNIAAKRVGNELCRTHVSEYLDISVSYAAGIEYGDKCISLARFHKLTQLLDVRADELLGVEIKPYIEIRNKELIPPIEEMCNLLAKCTLLQLECALRIIKACKLTVC